MAATSLFICHSSLDKKFVRRLKKELNSFRHDVWVDENEIKVGDSIFAAIEKGLLNADYVLPVLSPNFNSSLWATKELEAAFNLEIKLQKKKILPCLLKDTELPLLISTTKYADFRKKFAKGLIEILDSITPVNFDSGLDIYVTNSVVTLDIMDENGQLVNYKKKCTHRSIIDNNIGYVDCLGSEGAVENILAYDNTIKRMWRESGMQFFEVEYEHSLQKGQEIDLSLTADFVGGFTQKNEYWETLTNNHNADRFKVVVKFPESRPPKEWFLEERTGTKYFKKGQKGITITQEAGRTVLQLEIEAPVNFVAYLLRWSW